MRSLRILALGLCFGPGALSAFAQTLQPPFDVPYAWRSLGAVPGVPAPYGGVTFKYDDLDVLLIGGAANTPSGAIYAIRVQRAANGAVIGFQGTATLHATAPNNDGGLQYGPNNVLFYARYPLQEIGQIKPGSTSTDKVVALGGPNWPLGSLGALSFVPPGFPGAGQLKVAAYNGSSQFRTISVTPDGTGTFDLVVQPGTLNIVGGPEGLLYPPPGSPLLPDYARLIVTEYSTGSVSVYDIDGAGDPIPVSRQLFLTGLSGAEGATIDAQSGAFVFSTFGGGNQVVVVDGFGSCGTFTNYGSGIPGTGGRVPSIRGVGCATFNRAIRFEVGNGPNSAAGALHVGALQLMIPLFGGFVLTEPSVPIFHVLDAVGAWSTTLNTPNSPSLVGNHLYFQSAYLDMGAPFGIAASDGLDVLVR
jgi:hypothetical protein